VSKQRPFRGIPKRGSKAVRNGKPPTPIETAMAAAEEARKPMRQTLVISKQPIVLKADGRLSVRQGDRQDQAQMLVRGEDGLWHGVLMPPGSTFELRPSGPAAGIWTPPGSTK